MQFAEALQRSDSLCPLTQPKVSAVAAQRQKGERDCYWLFVPLDRQVVKGDVCIITLWPLDSTKVSSHKKFKKLLLLHANLYCAAESRKREDLRATFASLLCASFSLAQSYLSCPCSHFREHRMTRTLFLAEESAQTQAQYLYEHVCFLSLSLSTTFGCTALLNMMSKWSHSPCLNRSIACMTKRPQTLTRSINQLQVIKFGLA